MKAEYSAITGRLYVMFDSWEEAQVYSKKWKWNVRKSEFPSISLEDTLVNRIILKLPIADAAKPVAQIAVDGLLDFQEGDVQKLSALGTTLNRCDMGLGKTIETLACFRQMGLHTGIVFTKKSCITQWCRAINKWIPGARVFAYEDTKQKEKLPRISDVDFIVTNYDKLVGAYEKRGKIRIPILNRFGEYLCQRRWDMIIADEAHIICNKDTARHVCIDKLPSRYRQALTGTPIKNHPDNLYGILHWLDPRWVGRSYWTFVDYFCKVDEHNPWGRKILGLTTDVDKVNVLRDLLNRISVYHAFDEVMPTDKFSISEQTFSVDMEPKQKKLYENICNLVCEELPDNMPILNGMVQTIRCQQVATCPKIVGEKDWGPKFSFISDWLQSSPDIRLTVFSPWATTCAYLCKYLDEVGISNTLVTGQLSTKVRNENLRKFLGKEVRVLCATIGSIGTGTDGLQEVCNYGLFIEKDWSPEEMKQAAKRLYRIGQKKPVFIGHLEAVDTIDEKVGRVNIQKMKDVKKLLSTSGRVERGEYREYHLF